MKLLKRKNGAILLHDRPYKLFAGETPEKANNTFKHYSKGR